ncbi:MAG: VWA domain-containing protein [Candidatus Odinarchaeota archaeon]|nr:VWA domain-containing protein [Candidatus Odinarchaeota archaeon]
MHLVMLIDVSGSMGDFSVELKSNSIKRYLMLTPKNFHEKFLIHIDKLNVGEVMSKGDCVDLIAHFIREKLIGTDVSLGISWFNNDASFIEFDKRGRKFINLKETNERLLKVVSMAIHKITRVHMSGTDFSRGLTCAYKNMDGKSGKVVILTDGKWNMGKNPLRIYSKIPHIIVCVGNTSKVYMDVLRKMSDGKIVKILDLDEKTEDKLDTVVKWILSP